ncbi:MAG TPA: acyl-CoA dehydrogenase family protein [Solirubrobacteraceae bacterium]|jgi:alkylation response protein AidB-like acyl-CoA dehydrogenase
MRFELSEDQRDIQRTAREFLAARYPLERLRDTEGDPHWDEVAGLGWPELAIPEDQGGQGLGIVELCVVAEEAGYALAPTPLLSTWAAGLLLAAAGEGSRVTEGRRGTVAMWDESTAPTVDDGRLRGTKIAVPDAAGADVIVVTAGDRVFAVDAADVEIEPADSLDTTRPLSTVRLDSPATELDGAFDRAWHAIATATAAESVGVAARAMEMAVAYAKERQQFGRAIGSYQAVSHACAQMLLEVEGARAVTYWAAWALDHDPEAAPAAAACAKAYASDAGARVTRAALQVHGGIGFTWEHDLHFLLKRAEANAHAFGDARRQREQVAATLLD